jgi:hypothetical protein
VAPAPYQCKHGKAFDPAKESCPQCDAEPATDDEIVLGEGELLCAEAQRRGLPDSLEVEERLWQGVAYARARKELWVERADSLYAGGAIDEALKAESIAVKWYAEEGKSARSAGEPAMTRERIAAADRADREQARQERGAH